MLTTSLDDTLIADNATVVYPTATKGKRFANFVIDHLCYYLFAFLSGAGLMLLAFFLEIDGLANWLETDTPLADFLYGYGLLFVYYALSEYIMDGRTVGKLITGTRAVNLDGGTITPRQAAVRSLVRLVPFEPFSYLSHRLRGWHDQWSDTTVIDERAGPQVKSFSAEGNPRTV